jgi:isovaleryl-CoA dehydrogenase
MMRNLEIERIGLGAMSVGIARYGNEDPSTKHQSTLTLMHLLHIRRCVEVMNSYANERRSFGELINRFGQIQRHIAESYAEYMAGRCYTYQVR